MLVIYKELERQEARQLTSAPKQNKTMLNLARLLIEY